MKSLLRKLRPFDVDLQHFSEEQLLSTCKMLILKKCWLIQLLHWLDRTSYQGGSNLHQERLVNCQAVDETFVAGGISRGTT